ncbi:alpha-1,4-glucan--maltose-1-phosphate maltosyltransferase [Stakelama saccharophila]|uniref:Alpha-1,4-glucan:maltose-1-phosphate maltosyltransferase n=1 Tax=Stakelama saccharophila TaxID=3075605 RepID=A0ABZ0BBG0_9SPHN|nr:alpha-1,4-glucan--maltose-1-phosphate maltosyltransferase [Stakelama sp. W311]WNO53649.1 alpha-1,4-glucan--maltose-1-phosphate maltosyltransferase [Stakelama sp. W311]
MPLSAHRYISAPLDAIGSDGICRGGNLAGLARETGADAVLLSGRMSLFEAGIAQAVEPIRGSPDDLPPCTIEVDLSRFPLDHPLVVAHPEAFAVRRAGGARATVDPRRPMPAAGEALARLRAPDAVDRFGELLVERLDALASAGARGFRLLSPERLGVDVVRYLAEAFAGREITFLAGPLRDRASARRLGASGIDGLVTSFGRWDPGARWMTEEIEALRGTTALVAELSADHVRPEVALKVAPLLSEGLVVPLTWLASPDLREAATRAFADLDRLAEIRGEVREASAPDDPVTVIARGDRGDLRMAERIVVALINREETRPLPMPAPLLQPVGFPCSALSPLDGGTAPRELGEGDALLLRAECAPAVRRPQPPLRDPAAARNWPRLVVEDLSPSVAGGDFAVKRVAGDSVGVEATVFADGHEQLAAELQWRAADADAWHTAPMTPLPNDRWTASFVPDRLGAHEFRVEGWLDRFGGFRRDFRKKRDARVARPVDLQEGVALVEAVAGRSRGDLKKALQAVLADCAKADDEVRADLLLSDDLAKLVSRADDRPHAIRSPVQRLDAERLAARFSSWYELFPRSITPIPESGSRPRHGTFADVIDRLPAIRDMGFDTLYFPPIHPIGQTNRKGPNNTLTPGPDDPGSPYAIGSEAGGHEAIHPELGNFEDFDRLVAAAHEQGLEIALDFAIQCAPDHPWLKAHPGWFAWRPDGSMKYAENPPKKYQDIVNVDFYAPGAVPDLWLALRDIVLLWIEHGVKTFRVDNPHTKPLPFWEWMIADVRGKHPDVIFLAEAFTRPTMMYRLAKVGFSQSYTYFTWRDRKHELIEYVTELTTTAPREFYRPHFFVNTPDINPLYLQGSGRAGFRVRAVLAATLSGLFGVYSGFELCESAPLGPGKEEYLDSEKYEIRPRDYEAPGNIIADITLLNRLRRTWPALQTHLNTRFYQAYDDNIIWYGKPAADRRSIIMVMVNLDPHRPHECDFEVPLWEFGLADDGSVAVEDLAAGYRFTWHGKVQHIRIAPDEPFRLWRIVPERAS